MIKEGDTFGKLTAVWSWKRSGEKERVWKCTCKCGGYCYVKDNALVQGIVKNCGRCRSWKKELMELLQASE